MNNAQPEVVRVYAALGKGRAFVPTSPLDLTDEHMVAVAPDALRRARGKKGQDTIAMDAGIGVRTLQGWEGSNGWARVTYWYLKKLARALKVRPESLLVPVRLDAQPTASPSPRPSFWSWLRARATGALPGVSLVEGGAYVRAGGSLLLNGSADPHGYSRIVLEHVESSKPKTGVHDVDRARWEAARDELKRRDVRGMSMSAVSFVGELSDDPPRLKYRVVPYVEARSFLGLLQASPSLVKAYRREALDVVRVGTWMPNIVSTAGVVVFEDDDLGWCVLLARRRSRTGGFDPGAWAVGIGEQYIPVKCFRGNRRREPDKSIYQSILRGLREELLGEYDDERVRVGVHGLLFEEHQNNPCFLSLIELPSLGVARLADFWRVAEDRDEHDTLLALPLDPDVLTFALRLRDGPSAALMKRGSIVGDPVVNIGSQHWHGQSHLRLALALWYAESRA